MNINSIQGMNAYTANALQADTTLVRNNNDATDIELKQESTQAVEPAFQVDITQEALALQTESIQQAENTQNLAEEDQEQQMAQETQMTQQTQPIAARQGGQLDIIA